MKRDTTRRLRSKVAAFSAAALVTLPFAAVSQGSSMPTHAVSPGSPDRFAEIGDACPTFTWTAAPGATGYRLAVWDLSDAEAVEPDSGDPLGVADGLGARGSTANDQGLAERAPVIESALPPAATSWTPNQSDCLARSGHYAWAIEAELEGALAGGWSAPRLFVLDGGRSRVLASFFEMLGTRLEEDPGLAQRFLLAMENLDTFRDSAPAASRAATVAMASSTALPRAEAEAAAVLSVSSATLAAGSLRVAGDYGYAEPKAGRVHVGADSFVLLRSTEDDDYTRTDQSLRWLPGDGTLVGDFVAPVAVPEFATIVSFGCQHLDNEPMYDQQLHLTLTRRFGPTPEVLRQATFTATGANAGTRSSGAAVNPVAPGNIWSYALKLRLDQEIASDQLRFLGCTVHYTTDRLNP